MRIHGGVYYTTGKRLGYKSKYTVALVHPIFDAVHWELPDKAAGKWTAVMPVQPLKVRESPRLPTDVNWGKLTDPVSPVQPLKARESP